PRRGSGGGRTDLETGAETGEGESGRAAPRPARGSARRRTRRGPRPDGRGPLMTLPGSGQRLARDGVDDLELALVVVLVDLDLRGAGLAGLGEVERTAGTVVVDVLAVLEQVTALREGGALLAVLGDLVHLGLEDRRVVGLGGLGRERHDHHAVVDLRRVLEDLELGVERLQALGELLVLHGGGAGALEALDDRRIALGEALGHLLVLHAVGAVELVRLEAGLDELG